MTTRQPNRHRDPRMLVRHQRRIADDGAAPVASSRDKHHSVITRGDFQTRQQR
jgi:hypothetical protein